MLIFRGKRFTVSPLFGLFFCVLPASLLWFSLFLQCAISAFRPPSDRCESVRVHCPLWRALYITWQHACGGDYSRIPLLHAGFFFKPRTNRNGNVLFFYCCWIFLNTLAFRRLSVVLKCTIARPLICSSISYAFYWVDLCQRTMLVNGSWLIFFVAAKDKSLTFSSLFHCCCFFPPLSVGLVSVRYKGWTLPASGSNSCGCGDGGGGGGSPQSQG